MITIPIKDRYNPEIEQWLAKNVGPRLHYTHQSIGGEGWIIKKQYRPGMANTYWTLTLEDDKYATFFRIMFPE
jgi:hypothetical protein